MILVAVLFLVVGATMVIKPKEGFVDHVSPPYKSFKAIDATEHVSKERARVYGAIALLMGAGFLWLALQKPMEKK